MNLAGKIAIVTGAAAGIGRAAALRLAWEGASVVIIDIQAAAAERTAADIRQAGGTAIAAQSDIRDSARIREIVADVIARYGTIDVLVNNAGGPADALGNSAIRRTLFIDSTEEAWKMVLDVNLLGPMIVTRAVLDIMIEKRRGKIINIGSVAGVNGLVKMVDYSAAKGGVIAMTRALAIELGEYNININCVSPGSIDTRAGGPPTFLRRIGQPEEVASLIAFLASEESDFITGQNYIIDGGRVLSTKCQ